MYHRMEVAGLLYPSVGAEMEAQLDEEKDQRWKSLLLELDLEIHPGFC